MAPELDPKVMQTVEALGYRVTVGDVAAQAGLGLPQAESGLLALASEVGGHLQVAHSGDIAYTFPKNFRTVLLQKYWQLRLKRWLGGAWRILFYLIRISFGIALILSIGILAVALILAALAAATALSNSDDNDSSINVGGFVYFLGDLLSSALRLLFYADWLGYGGYGGYGGYRAGGRRSTQRSRSAQRSTTKSELNFFEAIFSFLFGDGNPNADWEERRWSAIGQMIRHNRGAIVAEQVLPFLDKAPANSDDADDAVLPVLTRFQGQPQVSPSGTLIYQFPELQVSAEESGSAAGAWRASSSALQEHSWRFSRATSGQLWAAGLLGGLNATLAIAVGLLLPDLVQSGLGFLTFVGQIYPLLLLYGLGFLLIPLIRWQVVKWRDRGVQQRNAQRLSQAQQLSSAQVQAKLREAQQFAAQTHISRQDSAYRTETDLISQEIEQQAQLDEAWQQQLSPEQTQQQPSESVQPNSPQESQRKPEESQTRIDKRIEFENQN